MATVVFPDGTIAVAVSEHAMGAAKDKERTQQSLNAKVPEPLITYSLESVDAIHCQPISVGSITCESMSVPTIHVESIISTDVRSDVVRSIRSD